MPTSHNCNSTPCRPPASESPPDPRSEARRLALQFLHQLAVQKGANLDQLDGFVQQHSDNLQTRSLARDWTLGAWRDLERIDAAIARASRNWDLKRINRVDRSNLRLAVHQLFNCPDVPPKVVINEAVELAKQFSTTQAPAFVNGVLDAIRRERPAEPTADETDDFSVPSD